MSTTIQTFNYTLTEFLEELSLTFDDVPQITLYKNTLPSILKNDERAGLNFFMNATRVHGDQIMNKDESMFDGDAIDLGMNLKISDLWHAEGLDEGTKDAMWNYLSTLFVLGMTLEGLSGDILNSIEDIAKTAAEQLKTQGNLDMSSLLPGLIENVSGMFGAEAPDLNDPTFQNMMQSIMGTMTGGSIGDILPAIEENDEDMPDV